MARSHFFPELSGYLVSILNEFDHIPANRLEHLESIGSTLSHFSDKYNSFGLVFVCTHNSRRSQIAQVWADCACRFFGYFNLRTYSAGTQATAFHPLAVNALKKAGFQISTESGNNPHYLVKSGSDHTPTRCFSKTLNHDSLPTSQFMGLMTCSDAEKNCPFIPGADVRFSLPYADPREADGTPDEDERYNQCVRQIGREIFYIFHSLQSNE